MRLLHVAAVAALALFACCDAAVADPKSSKLTSADAAALNDGNNGRFLRKRDAELDTNDEDKAMAELESMTERAGAAKTNYKLFYKAKMTPTQVAKAIGLSIGSPKQASDLQRFYLGYHSYYTAKKRRERRKKELEGYIYP
uniref:RxLR effector protein n=1 Tax=Phytophthora sojae TaxID=67593 RepID=G1FRI6_PHYSO|nr:Avh137 [Phytophthora sojae]AEK80724.1 Avh137 [Phytophthora sojae]